MPTLLLVLLLLLPLPRSEGLGLSFDLCSTTNDCEFPRTCSLVSDFSLPCEANPECLCVPPQPTYCNNPTHCPTGELCFTFDGLPPLCGSAAAIRNDHSVLIVNSPIGSGLSFDKCDSTSDCVPNRECQTEDLEPCPGDGECYCWPSPTDLRNCSADNDCVEGEVCTFLEDNRDNTLCMSSVAESFFSFALRAQPLVPDGLSQDSCQFSAECKPKRICVSPEDARPCIDRRDCKCFRSDGVCGTSDQCEEGEVCALIGEESRCASKAFVDSHPDIEEVNDVAMGVTPTPSPSPGHVGGLPLDIPSVMGGGKDISSGTGNSGNGPSRPQPPQPVGGGRPVPVCISSAHLTGLAREERVFDKDVLATVLCDREGSCATAGHLVVFRGQPMLMRSVCELVECSERVMHVNSPRYSRAWRGESFTRDLEFTAFAARYETKAEEMALRAAVRAGL